MSRAAAHLEQVESLIAAGRRAAAVTVLRSCLAGRNPFTDRVDAATRDLAQRYVELTTDEPAETTTIGWAVYLRRAALSRYGLTDARTHDTCRRLVELVRRRGKPSSSTDLAIMHIDTGFRAGRAVADRFAMVALLHAGGLCEAAEGEAIAALCQWVPHHDTAPDITYTYLVETLARLDCCGRTRKSASVLHAYASVLPDAGTEEDALLRARIQLKLGDRREIRRHETVCQRPHPPYEDLRETVMRLLAQIS